MVSAEKFCLRWNDFESNISVAFRELREDKDFFDVTLACDDDQIQAHKVILSACSPFFRSILRKNKHEHPLLYLKGVKYTDLLAVLNFMYHGEVNVAQEELNSFLAIAEDLKVKGLTQNKAEDNPRERQEIITSSPKQQQREPHEKSEATPQLQRSRPISVPDPTPRMSAAQYQAVDDDIQEVVPVKTEPVSILPEPHHVEIQAENQQSQVMDNSMAMYEESYAEYENYEESAEPAYAGAIVPVGSNDGNKGAAETNPSPQERDNMFLVHMAMVMDGAVKKWQCTLCGKMAKLKGDILDHVECNHRDTAFLYSCKYCSKVVNTNRKLRIHEYQHRCNEKHNVSFLSEI